VSARACLAAATAASALLVAVATNVVMSELDRHVAAVALIGSVALAGATRASGEWHARRKAGSR
jgi:hypothetical protein